MEHNTDPQPKLCVIFHLGTVDCLDFYRPYFDNIPLAYDLYVTCHKETYPEDSQALDDLRTLLEEIPKGGGSTRLILIENRGMDTGACLLVFDLLMRENRTYETVLKFHTKSTAGGVAFRQQAINGVLQTKQYADRCLRLLARNPTVGMVGAREWIITQPHPATINYMKAEGFPTVRNVVSFVGGTMFWARYDVLLNGWRDRDLVDMVARMGYARPGPYIEAEPHFVERMLGELVVQQGYQIAHV